MLQKYGENKKVPMSVFMGGDGNMARIKMGKTENINNSGRIIENNKSQGQFAYLFNNAGMEQPQALLSSNNLEQTVEAEPVCNLNVSAEIKSAEDENITNQYFNLVFADILDKGAYAFNGIKNAAKYISSGLASLVNNERFAAGRRIAGCFAGLGAAAIIISAYNFSENSRTEHKQLKYAEQPKDINAVQYPKKSVKLEIGEIKINYVEPSRTDVEFLEVLEQAEKQRLKRIKIIEKYAPLGGGDVFTGLQVYQQAELLKRKMGYK